jgi:signal transduction histidine kinase
VTFDENDLIPRELRAWLALRGVRVEVSLSMRDGSSLSREQQRWLFEDLQERCDRSQQVQGLTAAGIVSASVAHEVRNILTGVLGLSQLKSSTTEQTRNLELIRLEAERGTELLSNLLGVVRKHNAKLQPVDLREIVEPVRQLTTAEARRRGSVIECEIASTTPTFMARGDELRQVLLNLVLNALQALGQGGTVRIQAYPLGDEIVIEVVDNGPGIQPELLGSVFDALVSTKLDAGGTGLGLHTSRTLIEGHGGTLVASNRSGGGACFTIRLPADTEPQSNRPAKLTRHPRRGR